MAFLNWTNNAINDLNDIAEFISIDSLHHAKI
jgi:hypothetical protein